MGPRTIYSNLKNFAALLILGRNRINLNAIDDLTKDDTGMFVRRKVGFHLKGPQRVVILRENRNVHVCGGKSSDMMATDRIGPQQPGNGVSDRGQMCQRTRSKA